MSTKYEVWILHPATGEPLALVDHQEGLQYAKRTNAVGEFRLTLPASFDRSMAHKDGRVVVWREPEGGKKGIDFAGLIRYWLPQYAENKHTLILGGPDYNDILYKQWIPYHAGTVYTQKYQEADDLQKALVRENLGTLATDGDRDLVTAGYLTVAADASAGTVVWQECSWKRLLSVLQEVSDKSMQTPATGSFFGVVPLNRGFDMEFRTNIQQWGQDHRHPNGAHGARIFAVEWGNIAEASLETDAREEVNYAYVTGDGQEENRLVLPIYDVARMGESPLNRRETVVNASNERFIVSAMGDAGRAAIQAGRERKRFSFSIVETPTSRYGVDWGHGDYVTGSFEGEQYDLHVAMVQVTLAGQKETISSQLEYVGPV
jgi:hypothetical protein